MRGSTGVHGAWGRVPPVGIGGRWPDREIRRCLRAVFEERRERDREELGADGEKERPPGPLNSPLGEAAR